MSIKGSLKIKAVNGAKENLWLMVNISGLELFWGHWKSFASYESESKKRIVRIIPLLILFCVFSVLSSEFKELMASSNIHSLIWHQINMKVCMCTHTPGGGAKGASRRDRRERRRWEGGERRTKEEEAMYVTSSDILKVSYLDSSYRISDQLTSFLVNIFNSSSLHPAGVPYLCVIQHRHTHSC